MDPVEVLKAAAVFAGAPAVWILLPLLGRRERRELLIPTAAAPWVQLLSVDALGAGG